MATAERVAIITGGGTGVGAATCRQLAGLGWSVVVNYSRSHSDADQVAAAIDKYVKATTGATSSKTPSTPALGAEQSPDGRIWSAFGNIFDVIPSTDDTDAAAAADDFGAEEGLTYFHGAGGFIERFSMIKAMDILVTETLRDGASGWETIAHGFRMLVPRFLNPSKPAINTGNFLGHKAKMLGDNDEGTQVSFGFLADSFSAFRWWGAFLAPCLLMTAFVLVYRALTGPLERNAWQVFRLMLNDDGVTAFPTYEQLRPWLASMPCAGQASHETVARALTLLRDKKLDEPWRKHGNIPL